MGGIEASSLGEFLEGLYALLKERRRELPERSYTARLFQEGDDAILRKIAEESTEVLIAAKGGAQAAAQAAGIDPERLAHDQLVWEISDLIFHLLVLMAHRGISPAQIHEELSRRHTTPAA